ncbi:MAG: carboxypeptidase M32 [Alphaproteobacteria bacterium]|nr:carboxypeptidase M32 [Alphaproteobacteria bacterium]
MLKRRERRKNPRRTQNSKKSRKPDAMQAYQQLETRFDEIMTLREIARLLRWDRSVMMPELAADNRAHQMEVLNVRIHGLQTAPEIGELLAKADRKALDAWQAANIRLMDWIYAHATALPADLVARKITQEAKTEMVWRKARAESDFSQVSDALARLLDLVREEAEVKSKKLGLPAYDALMDSYAPHMPAATVDEIFDDIAAFTPGFLDAVMESRPQPEAVPGPFPREKQRELALKIIARLGMEKGWSRLDVSAHPFSTGMGNDVRITTRYSEDEFTSAIQAAAHEAGHGFYDHHTPKKWSLQPVGISQYMGMAIHESQSLSLDMQLARGRDYWEFIAPLAREAFGGEGPAWSAENLHLSATRVGRGFIRVEADEVTYPAHVILRYRLEKAMVSGELEVKDLPDAWNAGFKELIGVEPPDDRRGCLQDIHWYSGAFGYFPTYALGAFIAAQFVDKMKQDVPGLSEQIRAGNFGVFVGWLRDKVQANACLYTPPQLIEHVTGQEMSTHYYKKHLSERYLGREYTGSKGGEACSDTSAPEARRKA